MNRSIADHWPSIVARVSVGVGALYFLCYVGYVLTGWGGVMAVPPVALVVALLTQGFLPQRAAEEVSTPRLVAIFVLFLPAGVVIVEVGLLLAQGFVFTAFSVLSPVADYQRQWLGVTGFAGPLPFLAYAMVSAAAASLLALAIQTFRSRAKAIRSDA